MNEHMPEIGKLIVAAGVVLVLIGLVLWLGGSKLNWFGNLPGDIRVEKQNFRFYAPLLSMLLLSVVISLLVWLFRKLF
jgi:H+/Cl- antiporter ClcA